MERRLARRSLTDSSKNLERNEPVFGESRRVVPKWRGSNMYTGRTSALPLCRVICASTGLSWSLRSLRTNQMKRWRGAIGMACAAPSSSSGRARCRGGGVAERGTARRVGFARDECATRKFLENTHGATWHGRWRQQGATEQHVKRVPACSAAATPPHNNNNNRYRHLLVDLRIRTESDCLPTIWAAAGALKPSVHTRRMEDVLATRHS